MTDVGEMKIDPSRAATLASQIRGVSERIAAVAKDRSVSGLLAWLTWRACAQMQKSGPSGRRLEAEARQRRLGSRPAAGIGS